MSNVAIVGRLAIVFSSDWHFDLKTEDVDRNPEILEFAKRLIDKCVELQKQGYDVVLILGGDLFNHSTPTEKSIGHLIQVFNMIKKNSIKTYVLAGNHEALSELDSFDRVSCLSFVDKVKVGYPTISLVEDIKFMEYGTFDFGKLYFTFLPHVSRALIKRVKKVAKDPSIIPDEPQAYVEWRVNRILKSVGQGSQHIVFSHLNVINAHGGSEENLLKKSEVYVPAILSDVPIGMVEPLIVQAHIHTRQQIGNMHIVGSPIFCGYGEGEAEKFYAVVKVSGDMGSSIEPEYISAQATKFLAYDFNLCGVPDFTESDEYKAMLKELSTVERAFCKISVTIDINSNTYSWSEIKKALASKFPKVTFKDVQLKIIAKRQARDIKQTTTLKPHEAVQQYLKTNMVKKDPAKAKQIYKASKTYLGMD